nr:hypothetical protein [Tanacetum cinerariifolium]
MQYGNFVASSTEVIEQTYERLQKLISQLEMHGEVIPQEEINQKFLRSLSQEWTMHTIIQPSIPQLDNEDLQQIHLDDLEKMDLSQIMDKCKTGLGYNAVPPPYSRNFMPPKPDLFYPILDDFVDVNESVSESVVEKPTVESNEPKTVRKENGAPIIEDWVSESEEEDNPKSQTVKPNFTKIKFVKPKTNRKIIEQIRQDTYRSPRGNKRN